jgi:hypothetical protein
MIGLEAPVFSILQVHAYAEEPRQRTKVYALDAGEASVGFLLFALRQEQHANMPPPFNERRR